MCSSRCTAEIRTGPDGVRYGNNVVSGRLRGERLTVNVNRVSLPNPVDAKQQVTVPAAGRRHSKRQPEDVRQPRREADGSRLTDEDPIHTRVVKPCGAKRLFSAEPTQRAARDRTFRVEGLGGWSKSRDDAGHEAQGLSAR